MSAFPILHTERLILDSFTSADAPALVQLAGDRAIADTTISVPHPFTLAHAAARIEQAARDWEAGNAVTFAIRLRDTGQLIGNAILRDIDREHSQAELSFWIGQPWWGCGYATEATSAVAAFGFTTLELNRIHAHHMTRNPASGVVLQRIGMTQEGMLRQRVRKWGVFEDVALWAILRQDWAPLLNDDECWTNVDDGRKKSLYLTPDT